MNNPKSSALIISKSSETNSTAEIIQTGVLPYPPTINNYWKTRVRKDPRTGKQVKTVFRSERVRKFMLNVHLLLRSQNIKPMNAEKLRLELYVYPPDKKKRDIDNIVKGVCDALQRSGVYDDDFKICQLYIERCEVRKYGEVEFLIKEIKNA